MENRPLPTALFDFATETAADWQDRITRELKGAAIPPSVIQLLQGLELPPVLTPAHVTARPPLWTVPIAWQSVRALQAGNVLAEPHCIEQAVQENVQILEWWANNPKTDLSILDDHLPALSHFQHLRIKGTCAVACYHDLSPKLPADLGITVIGTDHDLQSVAALQLRPADRLGVYLPAMAANHSALASDQLAAAIAAIKIYSNTLGLTPVNAAAKLTIELSIGRTFLLEAAKLRAFRVLWQEHIGDSCPIIHGEITDLHLSSTSPEANLIRLTAAALSAILGGVHTLNVPPNDVATASSSWGAAARRHAVNIQHLLRYEANLGDIADPLGGAYIIEHLTQQLADHANTHLQTWATTQSLEELWQELAPRAKTALDAQLAAEESKQYRTVGVNVYEDSNN